MAQLSTLYVQQPVRTHISMVNSQMSNMLPASRSCAGCGGKIADRFLLFSMERYWHTRCLKCSCCQAQLGDIGTTCYSKGGMILCRTDYIRWEVAVEQGACCCFQGLEVTRPEQSVALCVSRLFGHSGACSACSQSIPASEMVMRAQGNVYHLKVNPMVTCLLFVWQKHLGFDDKRLERGVCSENFLFFLHFNANRFDFSV